MERQRAAASTVNLALASLDALYRCLGLGRPNVRRDKPAQAAPRALDEASQRLLLRAAEAAPIRARALVMLMLFTALRISEAVALDLDDNGRIDRYGQRHAPERDANLLPARRGRYRIARRAFASRSRVPEWAKRRSPGLSLRPATP